MEQQTTKVLSYSLMFQLQEAFEGDPWYGESLITKLTKIRKEAHHPAELNKTASYIQHLINWRQFVIKKLKGDADFDIPLNTTADLTDITVDYFTVWDELCKTLYRSQQELTDLMGQQFDDALKRQVPGKDYSFEQMLHGLIQHEVYHTGQIAVYWKNR